LFFSQKEDHHFTLDNVQNILVVRQHDQLGDMLCAVPLLRALKEKFPTSYLTLVTSPVNALIMQHHPYVDEVLLYDKSKWRNLLPFFHRLRSRSYDLAIVPATVSVSLTSDLIAVLSKAPVRIGCKSLQKKKNPSSFFFTVTENLDWTAEPHRHQTLRHLDILRHIGISTDSLEHLIGLTIEEQNRAQIFLKDIRQSYPLVVGFHPGAGKKENRFNAARFASLANRVQRDFHAGIVITVGPMDEEPFTEIKKYLQCSFIVVDKQPLRDVAAIINELDLYITNDTGVMHVAGGTKTNVLALFGPTDPLQWAPIGKKNRYIASKDGSLDSLSEEEVYSMIAVILNEIKRAK
jgi:ADP-heptose:LPS heptosyltransferase